ncbi:hypothetical protein BDN71DRAFT_1147873 [Pleurotus eryngii]|uniref:DUF6533 domain-containing protein n=1 Tax=Pleurotus eryngii TaxID=5323 RepID=A0A9P5ZWM1_PLEER|nr:hypothetical protein BDN71DRAFT_1147873 [Pleurotus eryngii]
MLLTQADIATTYHIEVVKVYDYVLTLNLEIEYTWGRTLSLLDCLFFFTRYAPFVDVGISLYSQLFPGLGTSTCERVYRFSAWSFTIGIAMGEIILTIRTWSLYDRSRVLGMLLAAFFLICWTVIFTSMGLFLESTHAMRFPVPEKAACFADVGNVLLYVCWCVLLVYDAGIMILMVVQAISVYSAKRSSPLLDALYIDGVAYYVFLFFFSLANVVTILTLSTDFVNLFSSFTRVLHSILTCRVVLHVREQANYARCIDSDDVSKIGRLSPFSTVPFSGHVPQTLRQRRSTVVD